MLVMRQRAVLLSTPRSGSTLDLFLGVCKVALSANLPSHDANTERRRLVILCGPMADALAGWDATLQSRREDPNHILPYRRHEHFGTTRSGCPLLMMRDTVSSF